MNRMEKKLIALFGAALALGFPLLVSAATTLQSVLKTVLDLVLQATPIAASLALLAFFWGLAMYLFNFSGKDEDKKKARDLMVYGVIAIFVLVSIFGIVALLRRTFQIGQDPLKPPTIEGAYPRQP